MQNPRISIRLQTYLLRSSCVATISHMGPNDDLEAGPSWREAESEVEDLLERVFAVWCVLLLASLADQPGSFMMDLAQ
jgi:hypothetical protein